MSEGRDLLRATGLAEDAMSLVRSSVRVESTRVRSDGTVVATIGCDGRIQHRLRAAAAVLGVDEIPAEDRIRIARRVVWDPRSDDPDGA